MTDERQPSFSVYRKPITLTNSVGQEKGYRKFQVKLSNISHLVHVVLHILFIKSNSKGLKMNYNAEQLELYC